MLVDDHPGIRDIQTPGDSLLDRLFGHTLDTVHVLAAVILIGVGNRSVLVRVLGPEQLPEVGGFLAGLACLRVGGLAVSVLVIGGVTVTDQHLAGTVQFHPEGRDDFAP